MTFDFDKRINRRDSESVKWCRYHDEIIPMWVADMDFLTPPAVIQALRERVDHGVFGYPQICPEIKEAIAAWLSQRHGWEVSAEHLILLPGVVKGFNLAAHAVCQPGQGVLVQTPTYGPFLEVADNVGLVQEEMELTRGDDGQYQIEMDAFRGAISEKTRIFMLCNPQNPTGRVFRQDELEAMAQVCLENDIIICSDEIHSDLIFSESAHIPIASLAPEIAAKTITLLAPSKTFNIAGLKASVAVIENDELRQRFEGAKQGLVGWVNLLGLTAMQAAYQEGAAWLDELLAYLEANRDYVVDFVHNELPGVDVAKPEGTYLAWLNCRGAEIPGNPSKFFREQAGVAMNDGAWFGAGGEGHVRFNFGCPRAQVEEALDKMKTAVQNL